MKHTHEKETTESCRHEYFYIRIQTSTCTRFPCETCVLRDDNECERGKKCGRKAKQSVPACKRIAVVIVVENIELSLQSPEYM